MIHLTFMDLARYLCMMKFIHQPSVIHQPSEKNIRTAIILLHRFIDLINQGIDGWGYWNAPNKASQKLQGLILRSFDGNKVPLADGELKTAIAQIKRFLTMNKKKLQNRTMNFEVIFKS